MAIYFSDHHENLPVSKPSKKFSAAVAIVDPETNVIIDLSHGDESSECHPRDQWGKDTWVNDASNDITDDSVGKRCDSVYEELLTRPKGGSALRRLTGENTFVRKVTGILNRFTPEKFDKLFKELLKQLITEVKCSNTSMKDVLSKVTPIIFDKALSEPAFSSTYAELCASLHSYLDKIDNVESGEDKDDPVIKTSKQRFQALLLDLCQQEHMSKENDSSTKAGKLRKLGNITLIAELFKRKLMPEQIVHIVVQRLLNMGVKEDAEDPSEEDVETVCKLMETAGKRMDRPAAAQYMDRYFGKFKKLSTGHPCPRARFLAMNIVDLRHNGWPTKHGTKPRRISERVAKDPHSATSLKVSKSTGCLKNLCSQGSTAKTVYITGIDSSINSGGLNDFLESHGKVVKKSMYGDPKHPTQYGFFEFETVEAADAVRDKDQTLLGSHRVHCSKSPGQPTFGRSKSGILPVTSTTGKYVAAGPHVAVSLERAKENMQNDIIYKKEMSLTADEVERKAADILRLAIGNWDLESFKKEWEAIPKPSRFAVLKRQLMTAVSLTRMTDERRALIDIFSILSVQEGELVTAALKDIFAEIISTELWLDVPTLWKNTSSILLESFQKTLLTAGEVCGIVGALAGLDEWEAFMAAAAQYAKKVDSEVDVSNLFTPAALA